MNSEKSQAWKPATMPEKMAWLKELLSDIELSGTAKAVAARLMMFHNDETGRCNPLQGTLAKATGLTRQSVNRLVRELEDAGWIGSTQGRGASHYWLVLDQKAKTQVSQIRDSSVRSDKPKLSRTGDTRCLTVATPGVADMRHQESQICDTEPSVSTSIGTVCLNHGPSGQHPAGEIGIGTAPGSHSSAPANDNPDHQGYAFTGMWLDISHERLADYRIRFPKIDLRAALVKVDAMLDVEPVMDLPALMTFVEVELAGIAAQAAA